MREGQSPCADLLVSAAVGREETQCGRRCRGGRWAPADINPAPNSTSREASVTEPADPVPGTAGAGTTLTDTMKGCTITAMQLVACPPGAGGGVVHTIPLGGTAVMVPVPGLADLNVAAEPVRSAVELTVVSTPVAVGADQGWARVPSGLYSGVALGRLTLIISPTVA
jgi:hypothetical protein